jgi:mannose-6-phosphate isomerase-like protein (cupin superfamily)
MLHRHDPFELYRVDEGELAFYLAREDGEVERRVAGAGESVAIAAGVEHTVRNESEATALATAVFAPAGEMEAFVRAAAELGPTPRPEDIIATAGSHGIEITRPIPAG